MTRYLRREGEERSASTVELFYDLVFVFAITQVSHLLLEHLTWEGVGQSALVLLVVWWSWNYTTWVTNELDTEAPPVRLVLLAVMLASLLMAVSIPEAFGDRAGLFVGAYLALQIGRQMFLAFVTADAGTVARERAVRICVWFALAAPFWIAGAIADGSARTALWLIALAIDYAGPLVTFNLPGLKRMPPSAWTVDVSHFAERFQLFIIIALGESIVLIGATTSDLELTGPRLTAFVASFLTAAAFFWLYFNLAARRARERLAEEGERRTLAARDAYTYLHAVMVAGIVVTAVGAELAIAHPDEELPGKEIAVLVAGPALFLLAQVLFRLRMAHTLSPRRLAGAAACLAIAPLGAVVTGAVFAALVAVILAAVIVSEQLQ